MPTTISQSLEQQPNTDAIKLIKLATSHIWEAGTGASINQSICWSLFLFMYHLVHYVSKYSENHNFPESKVPSSNVLSKTQRQKVTTIYYKVKRQSYQLSAGSSEYLECFVW